MLVNHNNGKRPHAANPLGALVVTSGYYHVSTIDHVNDSENVLTGSSEEMQVCKDQLSTADKMNFENGTGQILIKTCPEVIQNNALVGYAMWPPSSISCTLVF